MITKFKKKFKKKFEIFQIFFKFVAIVVIINNILIEIVKKTSNLILKIIFENFVISKIIMLLFKKKRFLKKNLKIVNKRIKMNIKIFISIFNIFR